MKEIGGYFGLEQTSGNKEYYESFISLNTARNALIYLIKYKKISKVYIPLFLCNSISNVLERESLKFEYYHIDNNFLPIFNKKLQKDEYLYIVNYYGLFSNEILSFLKEKYENIIIDNTHSFFQKPLDGVDTIYSCRKFFGVPDGAYLASNAKSFDNLETDYSENRMKHIYGRITDGATAHYKEFRDNDESFKNLKLMKMSLLTHKLLSNIDYDYCLNRRMNNYRFLHNYLSSINKLNATIPNVPYAYPLYLENGMDLKRTLAEHKIYVATLWPNVIGLGGIEEEYAKNILPLPCDQRYNEEDMKYIVEVILNEYKR